MKKVAIVTDTTACVPREEVARYEIEVVPVPLIINGNTYRDGIDITPAEFYDLLREAKKTPTTSGSSPGPYLEAFQNASQKAESILCLTEPAKFSNMFNSANTARQTAAMVLPGVHIEVMECTTAAAGQGLVAMAAAQSAMTDKPLEAVKETAVKVMSKIKLYATLDTLQYLVKSGRVPQAAALVNSILAIKPIFTLNHADAHTVALPRTMKSALERMVKLVGEAAGEGQPLHVAIMHANAMADALTLKDRIAARFNCREIFITEFTPVMGAHTGPGLIGAAFYAEG